MSDKPTNDPFAHLPRRSLFTDVLPVCSHQAPAATNKPKAATNTKTANRREKPAFNAYQRELMRKRRAAAKQDTPPANPGRSAIAPLIRRELMPAHGASETKDDKHMPNSFKVGQDVTFKPGPRSPFDVTAKVIEVQASKAPGGVMLLTKDAAGVERKVTPGRCKAA